MEVIKDFIALDPETQPRNVTAWTPVVTDVLRGSIEFEEEAVRLFTSPLSHLALITSNTNTRSPQNTNRAIAIVARRARYRSLPVHSLTLIVPYPPSYLLPTRH